MGKNARQAAAAGAGTTSRGRRAFLGLGAAGAAGLILSPSQAPAEEKLKTPARIVIAGAGAAGLAIAARLAARLDGARITLIDAHRPHFYQPGFTLVAAGIKPAAYVVSTTRKYLPDGVVLVEEMIAEFDPEGSKVVTAGGHVHPYDFLVVATGLQLDYAAIVGMDTELIGRNGLGSVYHSPAKAEATWRALSDFAERGGVGVFLRPGSEMKCAGAPLKYTFLADDTLRRRGTRGKAEIAYYANNQVLFSVPIVHERVRMLFEERGIETRYQHQLEAIDPGRRLAVFHTPEGRQEVRYDFINVIPPMRAPDAVCNSPLPWREGAWAKEGWLEVDKHSLRHRRFANVFAAGDVAGVPKGKTAASIKWQAPVVVDHLLAALVGRESPAAYGGYTSCPMITRLGRAMLIEFDYRDNLCPSFPGLIAPLEELWITWLVKTALLKPTYISMLRGRA